MWKKFAMTADMTIAQALAELRGIYGRDAPSYPQIYRAIIEARIPAEKLGRGWHLRREDMDRVRREFGLPARVRAA